jgi:hypothetical protein
MYCVYGGHRHPNNEVNLVNFEVIPKYSERGTKYASIYRVHLQGELIYTGQTDISNAIDALIAAYESNNQSFYLYHDDGTPTKHKLVQEDTNNLSGVKVVHRSWPKGDPAEYATTRTFSIVLQALYRDTESEIMEFRESLQFVGDGGPQWEWVKTPVGTSYKQDTCEHDTQRIIQSGKIAALSTWPIGNVPLPLYPLWEHRNLRQLRYIEPIFAGNPNNPYAYINYGIAWTYIMEAPYYVNAAPNLL